MSDFEDLDFEQVQLFVKAVPLDEDDQTGRERFAYRVVAVNQDREELYGVGEQATGHTEARALLEGVVHILLWAVRNQHKHALLAVPSEYIVNGFARWMLDWERRGWRTNTGAEVANRDLWRQIQGLRRDIQVTAILFPEKKT